ncbi:hypothetical protein [Endozoicomonas acroporae]|uniref:hypothetical protein n=1 Tax=Endozoicomonas acroporae TaxID=1701104 RepID=UPI003D7ABE29
MDRFDFKHRIKWYFNNEQVVEDIWDYLDDFIYDYRSATRDVYKTTFKYRNGNNVPIKTDRENIRHKIKWALLENKLNPAKEYLAINSCTQMIMENLIEEMEVM